MIKSQLINSAPFNKTNVIPNNGSTVGLEKRRANMHENIKNYANGK